MEWGKERIAAPAQRQSQTGIVPMILPFHILAGVLALVFGYVALYAAKGATFHRKSGLLFVFAMVTLSLTRRVGGVPERLVNFGGCGLLTFYFVTTALLTVRRRREESAWIDAAAMLFAIAVARSRHQDRL